VVRVSVRAREAVRLPIVDFSFAPSRPGLTGSNTASEGVEMPPLEPGQVATVDFRIRLPELSPGRYAFAPAICEAPCRDFSICEWPRTRGIRVLPGDTR